MVKFGTLDGLQIVSLVIGLLIDCKTMLDHGIFSGDPVRILFDYTGLLLIEFRQVGLGGHDSELNFLLRFICILSVHSLVVARILLR